MTASKSLRRSFLESTLACWIMIAGSLAVINEGVTMKPSLPNWLMLPMNTLLAAMTFLFFVTWLVLALSMLTKNGRSRLKAINVMIAENETRRQRSPEY